jgi:hypothetical protein
VYKISILRLDILTGCVHNLRKNEAEFLCKLFFGFRIDEDVFFLKVRKLPKDMKGDHENR